MKRLSALLSLLTLSALVPLASIDAQKPDLKPTAKKVYPKGRKEPKNLQEIFRRQHAIHVNHLKALPKATAAQYDTRTLGLVPPIRDQGQCGSCWDFSGCGTCTSALIKAGAGKADGTFNLSEQYVLDCGQNGGCDGDDNTTVLAMCQKSGLVTDSYGAYTAQAGSCKSTTGLGFYSIKDWGFCTTADTTGVASTQDIKNAMVAYGPIGIAIAADDAFMNNPAGTVFDSTTSTSIDHDVILVGWDDSKGKAGAWILRNSWGTSWCDNGYCYIGYGVNAVGTEAVWASAATVPPGPTPPSPGPTPPTPPVPPTPGPTPAYNSVTVALTGGQGSIILGPDQVAGVIAGSGATTITGTMTLREVMDALDKCRKTTPSTKEPQRLPVGPK